MKKIILVAILALLGYSVNAQEKKNKNAKHDLEVSGNCEMCKKRIEKAAYSVPGVKSAVWHQDDQTLHLIVNEQKSSAMDVKKAVAEVGHDAGEIKANAEVYEKLHDCCKYERKE